MSVTDFFIDASTYNRSNISPLSSDIKDSEIVTNEIKYNIIDVQKNVLLATFESEDKAEMFLINNPVYRRPEIKIIPTLTFRDMNSLDRLMKCFSEIYDPAKKTWFDNDIVNEMAVEFIEKIDDIKSNKSVKGYIP